MTGCGLLVSAGKPGVFFLRTLKMNESGLKDMKSRSAVGDRLWSAGVLERVVAGLAFVFLSCVAAPASTSVFYPLEFDRRALSGSFGEYRPTHLHAGVDFATFGQNGVPVKALANARVYRVRSSSGGYGNVLYLLHDDGRRSVYAHLERFLPSVAALFPRPPHPLGGDEAGEAMEVYPTTTIRVRRGQVIGWSGESGSGLPHLHLEVRDAEDRPIHPVTAGLLSVEDRVPPRIDEVIVEPADAASTVNGGGSPWIVDSAQAGSVVAVAGRCRVLVSASDVDGRLGGTLAPRLLRLLVDGRTWSTIEMCSFSYGRDREWAKVYDAYRTGFGPTVYVFDLTGPDGAAEVLSGRGALPAPETSADVVIEVEDMAGLSRRFSLRLVADRVPAGTGARARGGARGIGDDGEHIGPGGIVVVRGGTEWRAASVGAGRLAECSWSGVLAPAAERSAVLLGDVRILGASPGTTLYALRGSRMTRPAQAVSEPILLGPFGQPLPSGTTVSVSNVGSANGLARFRNGSWSWLGGSRQGDLLASRLDHLVPIVPVRDTAAPVATWSSAGTSRGGWARGDLLVTDDFSGVDAESVRVTSWWNERWRPVRGRFDRDRDRFVPAARWASGQRLRVEVLDRAGNASTAEVVVP